MKPAIRIGISASLKSLVFFFFHVFNALLTAKLREGEGKEKEA